MMTEITPRQIYEVMKNYRPECRFLKSAQIEYPSIRGKFLIGKTFYHVPPVKHATDVEIQLCLNQLTYVGMLQLFESQNVPELSGLDFSELRTEGMLITESRKRFRKPISTGKEFLGHLNIEEWKNFGNLLVARTKFDFENRSCFGNLELVLVKPMTDPDRVREAER
mgnify:CR=1 FL=1